MSRECGDCNLCCKIPGVGALQKKNLTWCAHCDIGKGCRIYETRPDECRSFRCLWLDDMTLPPEFAPTRARFITYFSEPCLIVDCDTAARSVYLDRKYAALFMRLAANLEPRGGYVIVCHGQHMVAFSPRRMFDLGMTRRTHVINVFRNPVLGVIENFTVARIGR